MRGWSAKARPCDREAGHKGSSGWTLGQYVYGSMVGITKETYRRPFLTKLLNRYMRQTVGLDVGWTALRVTCDYNAGPHVDCNEPESRNVVVPVSWFDKGQIWVEGVAPEGQLQVGKEVGGQQRMGYLIGGSAMNACFDPRKTHAVEPSVGSRRVLVGYTPRLFNRLLDSQKDTLRHLEFNLSSVNASRGASQEQNVGSTAEVGVGDSQGTQGCRGHEDDRSKVSPGGEGSTGVPEMELEWDTEVGHSAEQDQFLEAVHDQYMSLRRLEMEARKYFDEELEIAAEQGWTAGTEHLMELKHWIQELEQWIVAGDASIQLRNGVEGSEATVLRARLRKMGMSPEVVEEENIWVPLSGSPLEEPEGESRQIDQSENVRPPGPKALAAVPAAPLQTVSVSHREVLENIQEWKPSIGEEIESVFERHQALKRTTREQVECWAKEGKIIEYLPSKALFHRKGGTGRFFQNKNCCLWQFRKGGKWRRPTGRYLRGRVGFHNASGAAGPLWQDEN